MNPASPLSSPCLTPLALVHRSGAGVLMSKQPPSYKASKRRTRDRWFPTSSCNLASSLAVDAVGIPPLKKQ